MQFARQFFQSRHTFLRFAAKTKLSAFGICYAKKFQHSKTGKGHFCFEISTLAKTINSAAIMTNEASKMAKELEEKLNRHAQQASKNRPRTELTLDKLNLSIPVPMRAQAPPVHRWQFYSGDA